MREHLVLRPGVVLPPGDGLQVHRRELPLPQRILPARGEPADLFIVGDGEPVLAQHDAVLDEHPLEDRRLVQEPPVLPGGAEAHHPLHTGAVVPGTVEDDDLPGRRQFLHVPLEVPLPLFPRGRGGQCLDPAVAGVEVLGDALDRRPLPRGVPPLHDDDDPGPGLPHPLLHLHQLRLQVLESFLVGCLVQLRWGGRDGLCTV